MKNHYVGEVKDYYKYGLIRHFSNEHKIKTAVCWMLTRDDGKGQGNDRRFIDNEQWAHFDEDLYIKMKIFKDEILRDVRVVESKETKILENCVFNSNPIDNKGNLEAHYYLEHEKRKEYFNHFIGISAECELTFFDPDTGPQVKYMSKPPEEYLYWNEAKQIYQKKKALLMFQFSRMNLTSIANRNKKIEQSITYLAKAIDENVQGGGRRVTRMYTFASPQVLFILATQPPHDGPIDKGALAFQHTKWHKYGHPEQKGKNRMYGMVMDVIDLKWNGNDVPKIKINDPDSCPDM